MKRRLYASLCFALFAGWLAALVPAFAAGVVEEIQSPAWLDRGGLTVPAATGTALRAGDLLRTGAGGKLLLKLDEGSFVKLGENARFTIEKAAEERSTYAALLNVLTGAFRFTTQAALKNRPRDVKIRVGPIATVGIRGTDLWGRGRDDKGLVCLIEGKIDVTGNDGKTLRLDQERQLFQSARDVPPEPLGFVDPQQLAEWAAETEIGGESGAKTGAAWKMVIAGFASRGQAREALRHLRADGYPAVVLAGNQVAVASLKSERAARELADRWRDVFAGREIRVAK